MSNVRTRVARERRRKRIRAKISGSSARPRLTVFRSLNHIYVQAVDDAKGNTMAAASTVDPELKEKLEGQAKSEEAKHVGELIAKRLLGLGVDTVVFDRGGYRYHGRIKALADGAREAGLKF